MLWKGITYWNIVSTIMSKIGGFGVFRSTPKWQRPFICPFRFWIYKREQKGFSYWKYNKTWNLTVIPQHSIDVHFKKDVSLNVHLWRKYIGFMNHLMILLTDYWASFKLINEQNRYCIWKFPVFWLALEIVWTVNKDTECPRLKWNV